jgi:hypothetical protein
MQKVFFSFLILFIKSIQTFNQFNSIVSKKYKHDWSDITKLSVIKQVKHMKGAIWKHMTVKDRYMMVLWNLLYEINNIIKFVIWKTLEYKDIY